MSYILANPEIVLTQLLEHLVIIGVALLIAIAIALPISIWIARDARLTTAVLGTFGIFYTIPSIALIVLLIPFFGLGSLPVIIALILYVQVILVRNFVAALHGVDPAIEEAARGMGMNVWQRWWQVELPIALPVMLAGVRLAAIVAIALAVVGAKFGAGGLGRLLFDGIAQTGRYDKIWAGAIVVGALAITVNALLLALEHRMDPLRRIKQTELTPT